MLIPYSFSSTFYEYLYFFLSTAQIPRTAPGIKKEQIKLLNGDKWTSIITAWSKSTHYFNAVLKHKTTSKGYNSQVQSSGCPQQQQQKNPDSYQLRNRKRHTSGMHLWH